MMNTKIIAIIPARGGSKRIPKKNIIPFGNKPMIAWTIEAALESDIFDEVVVSTDSVEIAEISRHSGAKVPFMRTAFGDDLTPVSIATITALKQSEEHFHSTFDYVVQLMPNCPFRNAVDIKQFVDSFMSNEKAFQLSACKFHGMNPWWGATLDSKGHPSNLFPEKLTERSQDLQDVYTPTGSIWMAKRDELLEHNTFYGPKHVYYPLSWISSIDIDTKEDLGFAKCVLNFRSEVADE